MARQLRIEYAGAFYHIISRGNQRNMIFFEDSDFMNKDTTPMITQW